MRILDYTDLEQRAIEGLKGKMTALDVVSEEALGVGLRVVPPNSKVPKPGVPYAKGRRILFALRGSGTVSNGEYYEKVVAGKFVTLDAGEVPNFTTGDEELVMIEIRYNELGNVTPPTLAVTIPMSADATPAPRATSYDSVD